MTDKILVIIRICLYNVTNNKDDFLNRSYVLIYKI